jgi:hypothetical protein
MLTHAAMCVISLLVQGSRISKQEDSGLSSLSLLRIFVAVAVVPFFDGAHAHRCCVRHFNALAGQQHLKAGGLWPAVALAFAIVASVAALTFSADAHARRCCLATCLLPAAVVACAARSRGSCDSPSVAGATLPESR